MTHFDAIARVLAETGNVSGDEARIILTSFRHEFPAPDYLDRKLSENEIDITIDLYRKNQSLIKWISQVLAKQNQIPAPKP